MDQRKDVENKIRIYFKKKYGVDPTDSQLKETINSLKSLGKVLYYFFSTPSREII